MKPILASLICLSCAAISAQDRTDIRVHEVCVTITTRLFLKCQSTRPYAADAFHSKDQRYASPQEFARSAKVGDLWWPDGSSPVTVTFAATTIERAAKAPVVRLRGNAEIHTAAMAVEADEVNYHWDTGEMEAQGNVHVKPVALPQ